MSKKKKDAWEELVARYPGIAEAIDGGIEAVFAATALDEKTRQLVYIAAQTAVCYPLAVKYHVGEALKAGATKDEIVGAAAIASTAAGPKGFVSCFPVIVEEVEKAEGRC